MPVARPESSDSRIIAHVDMDCFYVQVEQRKQPNLRGQPTAVVQYNSWKGGGLIAVSYEARAYGVKRSMRGDEAKEVCPHIQLVQVPVARGKADLSTYRDAGSEVVSILARKGRCERASIDEVYLDLTDAAETMLKESPPESLQNIDEEVLKSHVLGLGLNGTDDNETVKKWFQRSDADHRDKLLACGAIIVAELRLQVLQETEFSCSAGIAHNKMLAKLASGMNKPAQQTVVPFASVMGLLEPLPIKKMKQLGGKLGSSLQIDLGVNTVGDLLRFPEEKLQDQYGINTGSWLWNIARGISGEEVQGRLLPKSHGSGKTFPGPRALKTLASVEHWLNELSEELSERLQSDLEKNKRIAHTLTLHASAYKFTDSDSYKKFPSKSCPLRYGTAKIQEDAFSLFQAGLREYVGPYITPQGNQSNGWAITGLSVSASKIVAIPSGTCSITKYFQGQEQILSSAKQSGCESPSGLHPTEPLMEWDMERTSIDNDVPNSQQQEDITCAHIDKDPHYSLTKQVKGDFSLGAESCIILKQTEPQLDSRKEETRNKCEMDGMRPHEQTRRKTVKEKGNSSILRFFQSHDVCSSTKEEHANTIQRMKSPPLDSQSKTGSCSKIEGASPQGSLLLQGETCCSMPNFTQNVGKTDAWRYNIDEIDQAVVNELPPEIQEELRSWLRPQKRANTVKRGSSIAHYFIPSNNAEKS